MNERPTTNPGAAPPRYEWRACCPQGHTHGVQLNLPAYFLPGDPILDSRGRPTGVDIGRHVDTDEEAEHRLWCQTCQDESLQRYYILRPDLERPEEGEHWYEDQARQWLQDNGTEPAHLERAAVCPDCGAPDVQTSGWLVINTGEDTGSEGPSSYHYCVSCAAEFKYTHELGKHEYPEPPAAHYPDADARQEQLPLQDQEESRPPDEDGARELEQLAVWIEHQEPGADLPALLRARATARRTR